MHGVFKELKGILHRSVTERGALQTLKYGVTRGPRYVQKIVGQLFDTPRPPSEFDRRHGVQTDGDHGEATQLRTLRIESPNWMHGEDYSPVDPERFRAALSALRVPVDGYTFVDFGCGKGRAMLLASEYPFRELVGIDFSRELTAVAERNWSIYRSPSQRCPTASFLCQDFLKYDVPAAPAVLYFYHPCSEALLARVVAKAADAVARHAEPVAIIYVNPVHTHLWTDAGFLRVPTSRVAGCHIYGNAQWVERLQALGYTTRFDDRL